MRKFTLICCVAALVGCSSSPRLSAAEFRTRANAICTESNAAVSDIPSPNGLSDESEAATIDLIVATQRGSYNDLRDLRPSKAQADDVDEWLDNLDEVLDATGAAADAVREGDGGKFDSESQRADDANDDADRGARKLRLTKCVVSTKKDS